MSDRIRYDFPKAGTCHRVISESNNAISEVACTMGSMITAASDWWEGDSYDGYVDGYQNTGGGKSTVEVYLRKVSALKRHIEIVTERKADWEITGKGYFN